MVANIEYIEGVIATYQAAARANRETPTRDGNIIVLSAEEGDDVMITADLHGHRRNFNAIKRIADLEHHPRRHLILQEVCHGGPTYPTNGGDMSHGMLEDVAKLKATYRDRVHFLLSNHELAELTDYPILKAKKMLNLMFRLGMQEMYGPATEKVREAYVEFLRTCPLAVRLPGGVFVSHSLPEQTDLRGFDASVLKRPLEALDLREQGDVFRLVWGRDYRPENAKAFAKVVSATSLIHGHEPCPTGHAVPNDMQIILDCCSDQASYILVPLNRSFTHAELVERIAKLV
ncbi:MAG: hypothetical protein HYX69_13875 [Planctomycetia bacterium]|nr:hypothetical protein [Planctomycetia bacterium]